MVWYLYRNQRERFCHLHHLYLVFRVCTSMIYVTFVLVEDDTRHTFRIRDTPNTRLAWEMGMPRMYKSVVFTEEKPK